MAIIIGSSTSKNHTVRKIYENFETNLLVRWEGSGNTRQQFQPKLIAIFVSTISTKVGSIAPLLDALTIEVLVINGCLRGISLALIADIYPNVKLIWPSLRGI